MEYIGISLQEYLIKYSGVDHRFITDFIAIQQSDISRTYYPFVVNLNLIIKWLQVNHKSHLKRTLLKSYIRDIDYILLTPRGKQNKGRGGHNKEIILVTVKCFKKICLKTKSIMSDKIVDYYLALEKLLIEYQQYIISELIKENKLLKNDLNNDIFPLGGLVYVLDLGNGYYKLGSTANLKQRKIIYETGMIHKLHVIFWFETDDMVAIEKCVKALLTKYAIRKRKEVYQTDLNRIIHYIKGCVRTTLSVNCEMCNDADTDLDHFPEKHPNLLASRTIVDINQFGGQSNCLEISTLVAKPDKSVYLVTDHVSPFQYIIKKGISLDISDEYQAHKLLMGLGSKIVTTCLPEVYQFNTNKNPEQILIREYIDGLSGNELDKLNDKEWFALTLQLAYFIKVLEKNQIQHNDYHLGNIIVIQNKGICLKVIDFETVTDYREHGFKPEQVKTATKEEQYRMGWANEFHPGSDLNQIFGELLERYQQTIHKAIYRAIKPRIKRYTKEFPFAISESNKLTTGKVLLRLIYHLAEQNINILSK